MKKIKAFTLAEVLLTLSIIGVIAAVTIPALTSSNNNKKYLALTKKALVTLQGATDTKITMTSTVPRGSNRSLFGWLTDTGSGDEETLKTVYANSANDTAMTPDGMAFEAELDSEDVSTRFKNSGFVYVDLNGAEGPTVTTSKTVSGLSSWHSNAENFDVVRFAVDEHGTFTASCNKAKRYLGI